MKNPESNSGFTLIELIVVLAGLGILSSLAIPNYMKYLDYAKVDEAKSLLNGVAADCLQGLRRDGPKRLNETVDSNIISMARLKNTGYVFTEGTKRITDDSYLPNCRRVSITAKLPDDRLENLPDIGFFLNKSGKLTKTATNSGKNTELAAASWAGSNTTDEAQLTEWLKLDEAITKEKENCKIKRERFAKSPGVGKTKMWDPVKTSKCTDKPPKFEDSKTCTSNGCTKDVWYIDGKVCGYEAADFIECQNQKSTAACNAEKAKMAAAKATTLKIEGDLPPNCKQRVWFHEGENMGSAESWKPTACERNKKKLVWWDKSVEFCDESPIYICNGEEIFKGKPRDEAKKEFDKCKDKNKDEDCENALRNAAVRQKDGGPYTSPTPSDMKAPVGKDCNVQYWYCTKSGKIYRGTDAEEDYKADEKCKNRKPKPHWCKFAPHARECQ